MKQRLNKPQVLQITVNPWEQAELQHVRVPSSERDRSLSGPASVLQKPAHEAQMPFVVVAPRREVEPEPDSCRGAVWKVDEMPRNVYAVVYGLAATASEADRWSFAAVSAREVPEIRERNDRVVDEAGISDDQSAEISQVRTGHIGDGGDVEFHVVDEQGEIGAVRGSYVVDLDRSSRYDLVEQPERKLKIQVRTTKPIISGLNYCNRPSFNTHAATKPMKTIQLAIENVPPSSVFLFFTTF